MTQPSYNEWRDSSQPTADGLNPQTIRERSLAALAVIASGINPDGSAWTGGSGGGGGGAVTSVSATGAGITATPTIGDVIVANTGVTSIVAGTGITVSGATGAVTVNSTGTSGVSSVFTRTGAVVAASGDYTVAQVTGAAPLASPTLTGTPAAPTATSGTNTTQLATTAFVQTANALLAPLASPTFTGTPAVPTASPGTNTTQAASTAFVTAAAALLAPLASPALTGTPTAPTKSALTNNTDIATTAYADAAVQVETTRAVTAEATFAVLTDGTTDGGTITVGTTAPVSPGPRDFFVNTAVNPFTQLAFVAGTNYLPWQWVTSGGILYQNQSGSTINQSPSFVASAWVAISNLLSVSTTLPLPDALPGVIGTSGLYADGAHVHPDGTWDITDQGVLSQPYDGSLAFSSTAMSSAGVINGFKTKIPVQSTVSNITLQISTQGAVLTSGQCFAALYSPTKTLMAQTTDQSGTWNSTGTKTMAITPQSCAPGYYYVVFWANGTTLPSPTRANASAQVNFGLSAANSRYFSCNTGITTTGPGTLGTFTALQVSYWGALT